MKISVPVYEFKEVISAIAPMARLTKSIGVSAMNGRIILMVAGEEISIEATVDCVVHENGSTFLPSEETHAALGTMSPDGVVDISTHNTLVMLRCGGLLLDLPTPEGSVTSLPEPEAAPLEADGGGLALCIARVQEYAKKSIHASFCLECLRLEMKDGYLCVIAIGFGGAAMGIAGTPARGNLEGGALITREAAMFAMRIMTTGPCKVWISEGAVLFSCGCYRLEVRQVNGKYPNWHGMVPPKRVPIEVPSEEIVSAMRQVSLVGEDRDCVHYHLSQERLTISRVAPRGKVVREIPIAHQDRVVECDVSYAKLMPSLLHAPKGNAVRLYIPEKEEMAMHVGYDGARFYVATLD